MPEKLKISIITVCLNSAKTIERAIFSVITQTYKNVEYIIIDGGSTDGTLNIIKRYASNISKWISEPDKGIYDAMNKGIAMATGDLVAFLNSDDWYNDDAIEYVANQAESSNAEIFCYEVNVWEGDVLQKSRSNLTKDIANLRIRMIFNHQGVFAKRKLFEEFGLFNTKYIIASDYDWLLRMYNKGVKMQISNYVVANFLRGGISTTRPLEVNYEFKLIAMSALNRLKEERDIAEEEFSELYCRISEHYKELESVNAYKTAINARMFENSMQIRDGVKKILPEARYSIFGCGALGLECFALLQQMEFSVDCFWDNDSEKWGTYYHGVEIKAPKDIIRGKTVIVVSSKKYYDEIVGQLCNMKLEENVDFIDYHSLRTEIGLKVILENTVL
jgi:glycosyltransferase involved in cell wall biosynthesis